MQRQLRDAIKSKYGVSNKTSGQVISALAEIERQRQGVGLSLPGRPGTQQGQQVSNSVQLPHNVQVPHNAQVPNNVQTPNELQALDIEGIVGGLLGGGSMARGGGLLGLLGLIISFIARLLGMGGRRQAQGGADVMSILGDLMGGATHPNQAPDLTSVLSGLLGSGGPATGSGSQSPDIEGLVTSLLGGGQTSSRRGPRSR